MFLGGIALAVALCAYPVVRRLTGRLDRMRLYLRFADALRGLGVPVATGRFGAVMAVELINDGPFTIWLDTADR